MTYNPYANYLESQVLSASPVELVAILYRAAIDSLRKAQMHLVMGDVRARIEATQRATNVVVELAQSLDRKVSAELGGALIALYDYLLTRIQEANSKPDAGAYDESIKLLSTLLEAWDSISQTAASDHAHATENREPIECSF